MVRRKLLLSVFLGISALFLSSSEALAQLLMTTPTPVATTPNREFMPVVVEDGLGKIRAFSPSFGNADPSSLENLRLFMSTYDSPTDSFGSAVQITDLTRVGAVAAVKDSNGALHLVIQKNNLNLGSHDLYWTMNSGSGWSAPVRLTSYLDQDTQPTLVALASGNLGLVFTRAFVYDSNGNLLPWRGYPPNYDHITTDLYQMTYTGGVWSAETPVTATPDISEGFPTLAQGPAGKLYLFYSSTVEGSLSLLWQRYESSAWTAPVILESGLMEQYLQQPSLINDVPGKYRLVYAQKNWCQGCLNAFGDYTSEIRYRTYDSVTNIWAQPVSVTSRDNFYADMPSAIFDSTGTYWVVFRYWDSTLAANNTDIYWMKSLPNTPVGTNVQVDLGYGSSITFSNVTGEGNSTLDTATSNPGGTGVFKIGDFFYDINTNASYTGTMTIRLKYSDQGMTPEQEVGLRMLHWLTGSGTWEDATVSVDTVNNILTGQVTSLSWIAISSGPVLSWNGPISNIEDGQIYALNDGTTLPIKFSFKDSNGSFVYDPNVSVTVSGNGKSVTFFPGTGDDNIRYDPATGVYIVNLHTKSYDWIVAGGTYEVKVSNSYTGDEGWITNFAILDGGKAQGKNK